MSLARVTTDSMVSFTVSSVSFHGSPVTVSFSCSISEGTAGISVNSMSSRLAANRGFVSG